ncbi:hypothetical protein EDD15DRAFT_2262940 [Pisolithus albus]|nr:hypothetical protein EDD15DRAFT_2262940 [Pisolithus albus]
MDGDIASATLPCPTFGGLHPPTAAGVENCADPTQCGDVGLSAGSTQTCSQYELVTGITAETDQRRCMDYSLLRQMFSFQGMDTAAVRDVNCFPADMAEMAHHHGVHYRRRDVLCLHECTPSCPPPISLFRILVWHLDFRLCTSNKPPRP